MLATISKLTLAACQLAGQPVTKAATFRTATETNSNIFYREHTRSEYDITASYSVLVATEAIESFTLSCFVTRRIADTRLGIALL